ncbi:MAG: ATPase, T2SS/T4P/T4SS family, partial [Nanoarchaeota archaeon]
SKEIIEKSRIDRKTFIEISRRCSTIVQCNEYRIVIVRPPVSDGWEITVVKPIKKLKLEEYHLKEKLFERIKEKSRGIIVAGEPGAGKSTFVQALGEFYLKQGKIIKTVESPRDLQLPDEITQYSKNFTSSEEIHDILFLSRPDNIIFDEMRDTPDFELYGDLRLAGAECIGVVHSSSPIDAVQRFISRLEVGIIPSVVDTILFVEKGNIGKVLGLKMVVKVPTGMTESDLARPVVEVRDFENEKLEYEIYSYGEQTVVIPVGETVSKDSVKNLARIAIEKEFKKYCKECNVDVVSNNRVVVQVPERDIARIIGKDGKVISQIEKDLGISIEIKELKEEKKDISFKIGEDKKVVRFYIEPGREVQLLISGKLLLTAYSSRKGEIKIHKESQVGRKILEALRTNKVIEIRG